MSERQEGGDALIHLRVPAAVKGRWVRASRAAGMRLTDWIVQAVEAHMLTQINIPAELAIADLKLAREADGSVSFDVGVIARIEAASGLPEGHFMGQPEDALAALLSAWYRSHLRSGGAPDPVWSDLIGEVRDEESRGQHVSHQPGRA